MAYVAPTIGIAGLTIPSYQDILDDLVAQFKGIYGQSVYLGNDSADYQLLSVFALRCSDTLKALQFIYNNRAPLTAVGSALDGLVKLNGLARKPASYSTCQVTITGTPGTTIYGGIVQDTNGKQWALPTPVIIPGPGTVIVTATCMQVGAIQALIGTITIIATPAAGWVSVNNAVAAVAGQPIEPDSALRARQAISTALPSITMLAGTTAAIAAVTGVTRYNIFENPTGGPDAFGTPAHSLTCVVEGGTDAAVAQAIYDNRGIGCLTNGSTPLEAGSTSVNVTDPNNGGLVMAIGFYRPDYKAVYVSLTVKKLAGYTSSTNAAIKAALVSYLNSLQIGEGVTISALYGAALSVMPSLVVPLFSITALTADFAPGPVGTVDLPIDFHEVSQSAVGNIVITEI